MANDWWAKKLGSDKPQPQFGITVREQPPQSVPEPVQPQPQQVQPAPAPQQSPAPQPPGRQKVLDPNRHGQEQVNMGEALRLWEGGEAQRKEGGLSCPECGSLTGYTNYSGGSSRVAGHTPRSHCFECGYNGHFQQGDQANWS